VGERAEAVVGDDQDGVLVTGQLQEATDLRVELAVGVAQDRAPAPVACWRVERVRGIGVAPELVTETIQRNEHDHEEVPGASASQVLHGGGSLFGHLAKLCHQVGQVLLAAV